MIFLVGDLLQVDHFSSIHYKLIMEHSQFLKLTEVLSETECQSYPTLNNIENPEPQTIYQESSILVRFRADQKLRRFDPAFLKYSFQEIICENESEKEVMASHCCQDNADFFHDIGNGPEELKCYEMMLRNDPKHLPSLEKAARLSFEMDRMEESIRHYKTINLLYPKNVQAYYNLAAALRRARRPHEAKVLLEKYMELAPDKVGGYKAFAEVAMELHDLHSAIHTLEKCLEVCSNDAQILNILGNLHFSTNPERATELYLEGVAANPKNPYNFNGLGVIYNSMRQFERAVDEFRRAISLNPADPDFHYNLALALKGLSLKDEAQKQFKTALHVDPSYYLSYEGLANLSLQAQQFSQAIGYYLVALEARPDFSNAAFNLAFAYQSIGDLDKAAKSMEYYLRLQPTDFNAYHRLATIKAGIHSHQRIEKQQLQKATLPKHSRCGPRPAK